jgi:gliding motility-associated-like protein
MKKLFTLIILLCFGTGIYATHQRSGEITYRHISGLTYEFTIVTYTFAPSPADRCELEILWGDGTSSVLGRVNGPPGTTPSGDCPAIGELITPRIRKNVYTGLHTFSGAGTYTISVEDPNRNAGVINIPNSVDVPFYVQTTLTINPFLGPNNSVQLLLPPIDNGCVGYTFIHNTGAFDPDGDSLSYSLVSCRGLGGLPIPGYSLPQASESIAINPVTGDLIWETPIIQGEYNIAILIEEWRNGIRIGTVIRDLQIIIGSCENNPNPPVFDQLNDTCVAAGETLRMRVRATDADGDVITLTGYGEPLLLDEFAANFPQPIDSAGSVSSFFIWSPGCLQVRQAPYLMYFKAQDNGTPVNLIALQTVSILVVGPAIRNLQAEPLGNRINLNWDPSICSNILGYKVYRRIGASGFVAGNCITGVPPSTGYSLISGPEPVPDNFFTDDGQGVQLIQGIEYCYLVIAVYPDGSESYASEEVCAALKRDLPAITNVSINTTSAEDGEIYIAWSAPTELDPAQTPGPFIYMLKRGIGVQAPVVIDSLFSLNDTIYIDRNLNTAGSGYTYVVDLINNTPGNRFFVGSSRPAASMFLQVQPGDERLSLTWNADVPWINTEYVIYRQLPGATGFDSLTTVNENFFVDRDLQNDLDYCYFVKSIGGYSAGGFVSPIINYSQERCAVPSDVTPPCPPLLELETDCDIFANILRWTNPNNYCPDTEDTDKYYIWYLPLNAMDYILLDSTLSATDTIYIHRISDNIQACYMVTAADFNGNTSDFSNEVCVPPDACPVNYRLPNVFTPNGDGYNDLWVPFPYLGVERINLVVRNRWGNKVFETNNPDINWDGKNSTTKAEVPDGVYFYVCEVFEITDLGIQKRTITGSVHILR